MINSLQKERGLNNGYIRSKHQIFITELKKQRIKTDTLLDHCKKSLMELRRYVDTTPCLSDLGELMRIRSATDSSEIDASRSLTFYTHLIEELIGIIRITGHFHMDEISNDSQAPLLVLMHLKENIALLRSEGIFTILQGKANNLDFFQKLLIREEAYRKTLRILASPALNEAIERIEASPGAQKLKALETTILQSGNRNDWGRDIVYRWYWTSTEKIEQYEKIIEEILHSVHQKATELKSKEVLYVALLWSVLFLIVLLTFLISYALKQSIIEPIESLTHAMQRLTQGDKHFYFNRYQNDDIIGKMVNAYNELRKSMIKAEYSRVLLDIQEQKTENLEKIAYLDPLTGALNRRRFEEIFQGSIRKAKRNATPLCVLLLDLDHFKRINDSFGHEIGDHVLKKFSDLVQESIRTSDVLARIGGEEFALLLKGITPEDAQKIAETIRSEVETIDFSFLDADLTLTVSIGIACYHDDTDTMEALLREADRKLYEAKKAGRNRVCA
jgi:diguanylate cyclase (GGDEF)-like protein